MMLNDGCKPPTWRSLGSALPDFNAALSPLIQEMMSKNNPHLQAVMDWVDMEQIRQTIKVTHATEPSQDNAQTVTEQTKETDPTDNTPDATETGEDNAQNVA